MFIYYGNLVTHLITRKFYLFYRSEEQGLKQMWAYG
jgi:hypothetical protein